MPGLRVGIDVGGTFTDIVFLAGDGTVTTRKILSSPDDYRRTIRVGLREIIRETGLRSADVQEVMHGTTVATNAILEGKGAPTGLITTRGFRDVLEIRRMRPSASIIAGRCSRRSISTTRARPCAGSSPKA
jgi:N-methylhydantoinase A